MKNKLVSGELQRRQLKEENERHEQAKKGQMIVYDEAGNYGCGVLFKSGSGIIICGENRVDGNSFLCQRCLKELKELREKVGI